MSIASRISRVTATAGARLARLHADARRISRVGRRRHVPNELIGVSRHPIERWIEETAAAHDSYRAEIDLIDARVAAICSSHRPADLDNIIAAVGGQTHADLEFIFVAHGDHWQLSDVEERLAPLQRQLVRVRLLSAPASATLGSCLNQALVHTDARFIAKFDGDDRYGAEYLSDSLRAHALADAGIVGKYTYYAHLEADDRYLLRFPGHEFQYTSTMSGGTFVIDRDIVDDQRFADVSIGEDRDYIRRCHRRGISTFAGDRFNYTVVRSGANTWTIDEARFVAGAIRYGDGWDPSQINR